MSKNTKYNPVTNDDLGSVRVECDKLWYDDGDSIYPRRFVRVNEKLITREDAEQVIEEIQEELE